jgi:hypothetical protein
MGEVRDHLRRHFATRPHESRIADRLVLGFSVMQISEKRVASQLVEAWTLKPDRSIKDFFGFQGNLLAMVTTDNVAPDQMLQLHDDLLTDKFDPMASVIVSPQRDIRSQIKALTEKQPERSPIAAMSVTDLETLATATDLGNMLAQQLFRRNLFNMESPLERDSFFFGRHQVVSELLDRFNSGQNSGLFGLRRIGKTSVLFAVTRRCVQRNMGTSLYLSIQDPGRYRARWFELLQAIVAEVATNIGLEKADRLKLKALGRSYTESTASSWFKSDIRSMQRHFPNRRLLLCLDELEWISFGGLSPAEHWNDDFLPFWQTLRSLHQDTQGEICYLVAGVNPHPVEQPQVPGGYQNPLFDTIGSRYLSAFTGPQVREMVQTLGRYMGLRAPESLCALLAEVYGGHPFLIRLVCGHLADQLRHRPAEVTELQFVESRNEINAKLAAHVRLILQVLAVSYPFEYELIRELARGNLDDFVEFANASPEFTAHMKGYGLVSSPESRPRIQIDLVADYLRSAPSPEVAAESRPESGEDVVAWVSRRRDRVERRLRRLLADGLSLEYGPKRATERALAAFDEKRRGELMQYSYRAMWAKAYFK